MIAATPSDNLQEIFDKAHPGDVIRLAEGIYRTKAEIFTPGLTLLGAGAERTRIIWDDFAKQRDIRGMDYKPFRTWTLAVCADGVTMKNLSIINDTQCPGRKGQEIALTVYADDFTMEFCRLASTRNTLFLGPLPPDLIKRYDSFLPNRLRQYKSCSQRFYHCLIEGTTGFIFGRGAAVFDRCGLRSLYDAHKVGFVAAPAHNSWQTEGFLFRKCWFLSDGKIPAGNVYLARPWRDHGLCSFQNCSYGTHISPLGFDKRNGTEQDKTARFYETPPVSGRVSWVR